jgi:hypothetical protein
MGIQVDCPVRRSAKAKKLIQLHVYMYNGIRFTNRTPHDTLDTMDNQITFPEPVTMHVPSHASAANCVKNIVNAPGPRKILAPVRPAPETGPRKTASNDRTSLETVLTKDGRRKVKHQNRFSRPRIYHGRLQADGPWSFSATNVTAGHS